MEKKRLDRRNLLVLIAVVAVIALAGILSALQLKTINPTRGELTADPTSAPAETSKTAEPAARNAVKAYLVVTVAGQMYEPIPLIEPGRYTIRQGEDMINVVEVTSDSIRMHSSSCENQDCVEQGVVSLDNRSKRVLQNMVICLPNQVTLELYTAEEIAQLLLSMAGYTGEE